MTTPDQTRPELQRRIVEAADAIAAAAPPDGPAVPEGREPAAVTGEPSDEEIIEFWSDHCAGDGDAGIIRLARWGHPTTPAAPDAGDAKAFKTLLAVGGGCGGGLRLSPDQCRHLGALLERLSAQALQPVAGWQPIDTAPKDGTEILASDYDAIEIVSWNKNLEWEKWYWTARDGRVMFPAWWQPLPDHPPLPTTTPAGQEGANK